MPDITMCTNPCAVHHKCYRSIAVPDPHWQSYSHFECPDPNAGCEYFIKASHEEQEAYELRLRTNAE